MKTAACLLLIILSLGIGCSASERLFYKVGSKAPCGIRTPDPKRVGAVEARWSMNAIPPATGMAAYHSTLHLGKEAYVTLRPGVDGIRDAIDDFTDFFRVEIWIGDSLAASADVAGNTFAFEKGKPNSLGVEWGADSRATIYGGGSARATIATVDGLPRPDSIWVDSHATGCKVAYFAIDLLDTPPDKGWPNFDIGTITPTADMREASWQYLDRENNPRMAIPGGRYSLATVADNEGGYWIVYMDGATTSAALWKPGRVKGRLKPTGFIDHYNVEWISSEGQRVNDEAYADFDSERTFLTITFPLHEAKMRFSRRP